MTPMLSTVLATLSLLAACMVEEPVLDDTEQYLVRQNKVALNKVALNKVALNKVALNTVGLNKVALNKVALNKVALNKADLDLAAPESALARVDVVWDGSEYDVSVTRRSTIDQTITTESNDEGTSFRDVSADDLVNLFEKSARCLNANGVATEIYVNGALRTTATGMFGLSSRRLTHRAYIESYMSCMAVWANDQSVEINATADLPPTTGDVRATLAEAAFNVPAESVGYKLVLGSEVALGGATYVEIDGVWLWNMSRHQSWSATYDRLRTWYPALGGYDRTTNRHCLNAALAHAEMPAVCGGTASKYWEGPLTSGLRVPVGERTVPWCTATLGFLPIDRTKGTGCTTPEGAVSSVFYADLRPTGIGPEEFWWNIIIAEMSAPPPHSGGSGSGSGNGSGS